MQVLNKDIIEIDIADLKLFIDQGNPPDNNTREFRNSPLCFACMHNRTEVARLLIESRADVNFKGFHGRTPLFYAADKGNIEIAELLVSRGADINLINNEGKSILMDIASHRPGVKVIKWLIDHGININYKLPTINRPVISPEFSKYYHEHSTLTHAVINGAFEMVKLLVTYGADGVKDGWDKDLFFFSLERESEEIPLWLLSNYTFHATDWDEWAHKASDLAKTYGHMEVYRILSGKIPYPVVNEDIPILDVSYIKKFIDDSFQPDNKTQSGGNSALCFACLYNKTEMAQLLIDAGVDINIKGVGGKTPLMYAAANNNVKLCELLHSKGADINTTNLAGDSILTDYWNAKGLKEETIRWLIEKGIDVNFRNSITKSSALSTAVQFESSVLARYLIEHGADGARDGWHEESFTASLERQDDELSYYLLCNYKGKGVPGGADAIIRAIRSGHNRIVKMLLELTSTTEKENGAYENIFRGALIQAIYEGNQDACRQIIGIYENKRTTDVFNTPLQNASRENRQEIVRLLLEHGADVNSKDHEGNTSLILAASNGHTAVLRALLDAGADIHAKNNVGWTALMQASLFGYPDTVKYLLDKGGNANDKAENERNITALMLACDSGIENSVKLLLEHGADPFAKDDVGLTAHKYAEYAIPYRPEITALLPPLSDTTVSATPLPKVDLKDCPICKGINHYQHRQTSGFGEDFRKYFFKVMTLMEQKEAWHEDYYKYYTRTSFYKCPRCDSVYKKRESEDMDNVQTQYDMEVWRINDPE